MNRLEQDRSALARLGEWLPLTPGGEARNPAVEASLGEACGPDLGLEERRLESYLSLIDH
jgi:hypothetical protein